MIDINNIGSVYKIIDNETGKTKDIQIIYYEEFLCRFGTYDGDEFPNYTDYLNECTSMITGTLKSPYDLSWYAARYDQIDIVDIVKTAIVEGNTRVVVEILP